MKYVLLRVINFLVNISLSNRYHKGLYYRLLRYRTFILYLIFGISIQKRLLQPLYQSHHPFHKSLMQPLYCKGCSKKVAISHSRIYCPAIIVVGKSSGVLQYYRGYGRDLFHHVNNVMAGKLVPLGGGGWCPLLSSAAVYCFVRHCSLLLLLWCRR